MARASTAAAAVGFAVRKDIRNNLVREVDRAKHRQMWETASVVALLLGVVLFSVWQRQQLHDLGISIENLRRDQAIEDAANRRLRLEIETLSSPSRIEDVATHKLKMITPAREDAIVIERVTPPAPPPKSIVASK